jgi:hypothetical protein
MPWRGVAAMGVAPGQLLERVSWCGRRSVESPPARYCRLTRSSTGRGAQEGGIGWCSVQAGVTVVEESRVVRVLALLGDRSEHHPIVLTQQRPHRINAHARTCKKSRHECGKSRWERTFIASPGAMWRQGCAHSRRPQSTSSSTRAARCSMRRRRCNPSGSTRPSPAGRAASDSTRRKPAHAPLQ